MKKYMYECDGGSILIGNETFACHIMNNIGDGMYSVIVYERGEFPNKTECESDYCGAIRGTSFLYNYDCYDRNKRKDKRHVLCELNGLYGIFASKRSGTMHIVKWNDDKEI